MLNNPNIEKQVEKLKCEIIEDEEGILNTQPHLFPFFIFLSPKDLNLKRFISSKTFLYKITLEDFINYKIHNEQNANTKEILAFLRKINVLFSYYNELGDLFSFENSKGDEILVKLEDDINIPVFINILLLGRSGAGKSTLLNLLLDEKKSIEGGTGFSTTSKNILVYHKADIPLRFYDVKGIESEETVQNYLNILTQFNAKNNSSENVINAIFYCKEFKTEGTIIEKMEICLFEKLIEFKIPILFIFTKCPFNPYIESKNFITKKSREKKIEKILNAIKDCFHEIFIKNKRSEEEYHEFINNYIKFYFVNLRRDLMSDPPNPPFGIDKVLSFFTQSVSKEDWENLEINCYRNEEENCENLCKNNAFLKAYADFDIIQSRNKNEALNYLKSLKAGAFFSGMVPGLDIGMEYFYRHLFKNKLKHLYGFDYEKAENLVKNNNDNDNVNVNDNTPLNKSNSFVSQFSSEDSDKRKYNIELEESKINIKIDEDITNKGRNAGAIIRGAGEVGGIVIKALPTAGAVAQGGAIAAEVAVNAGTTIGRVAISGGLKIASWVLLPVTCIAFGAWSCANIHKDCHKILDIFDQAYTPLRFETLLAYAQSFRTVIDYLDKIFEKILEDDKKDNERDNEED